MKVVERTWNEFWAYYWRVTQRKLVPNIGDYDRKVVALIEHQCVLSPTSRILDLGCGSGEHVLLLSMKGYKVTGVDVAASLIEYARSQMDSGCSSATFVQGDMRRISYDEEFDVCTLLSGTFGFFSETENQDLLQRIGRSLVQGGRVFIMYLSSHRSDLNRSSWKEIDDGYQLTRTLFEPESSLYHSSIRLIMNSGEVIVPKEEEGYHATECIRCYTPPEISTMLKRAGFANIVHVGRRHLEDPDAPDDPCEVKEIVVAQKCTSG